MPVVVVALVVSRSKLKKKNVFSITFVYFLFHIMIRFCLKFYHQLVVIGDWKLQGTTSNIEY